MYHLPQLGCCWCLGTVNPTWSLSFMEQLSRKRLNQVSLWCNNSNSNKTATATATKQQQQQNSNSNKTATTTPNMKTSIFIDWAATLPPSTKMLHKLIPFGAALVSPWHKSSMVVAGFGSVFDVQRKSNWRSSLSAKHVYHRTMEASVEWMRVLWKSASNEFKTTIITYDWE